MSPQAQFSDDSYVDLSPGDPAPNPGYALDIAAGRHIVLCFYATSADAPGSAAIEKVLANRHYFDDRRISFFGFSLDSRGTEGRMPEFNPGIRFILDSNWTMSRHYGAVPRNAQQGTGVIKARRFWIVLDPTLRVLLVLPLVADGSDTETLFRFLGQLPTQRFVQSEPSGPMLTGPIQAPILFLPNVFEFELCRRLVDLYEANGGQETGTWDRAGGKAISVLDRARKRRRDYIIKDNLELINYLQVRISRRVYPEILKAYAFKATYIERFMVSCYSAEEQGYFTAHRDNTTEATAHRRFAVSVNLNCEFEGGEITFPEYGSLTYKPPPGGAVVFSCSLLHAVSQVTAGRRYAFLPFLYDDDAASIRSAKNPGVAS